MSIAFPPKWKAFKLDQLGTVGRGRSRHRPRNDASLYGGECPFFQTGDVKAANLYLSNYSQTYNERGLAQSKQWEAGTLCITIAANIADTAILSIRGCFPDSVIGFVCDPMKADTRFIKYYIDLIKLEMQQVSHGTTQDNLSLDKLLRFDFVVPDIEEQRKIARILSAYDDLIENNLRRIKILEEMAQNLYREWFVKFRFPGHQHAHFIESSLGRIPDGWEAITLSECTSLVKRGISPKYDESASSIVINQKCIRGLKLNLGPSRRHIKKVPVEKYIGIGDVLINSTGVGTLGRVCQVMEEIEDCTVDSHVTIVRPLTGMNTDFFGLQLFELQPYFERQGLGATGQTELGRTIVEQTGFLNPSSDIQQAFSQFVVPFRGLAHSLGRRNGVLRGSRDLLLPKLISGELDISDLDISIPKEIS